MVALVGFLSGCAHSPKYSDAVAVNTLVLSEQTQAVVVEGNAGHLSLADSRQFLQRSRQQARGMRARADECHLSADEVKILDWLDGEYATLLRRPRPLRSASALRLQNSIATLQRLRPVRIYHIPSDAEVAALNDSVDNSTSDTTNTNNCHDGHDHGGRDCGCDHGHK